jgi:defect-in-organelle-trafficking protein DotA
MGVTSTVGSIMVLGTGLNDAGSTLGIMMAVFIVPAFWALMGILVSVGALLAIYTPLLPFIYFTFGALAWMISTIEAMVAGPLVALGIISPSGQHEIMGKAEPAIMLLFGIFLRPTLMIFGLMAAMLLAITACNLVNATFAVVMQGWVAYDPLSLIFVLVAYVSLILAVLNQCFKVINLIPQQVMRWIGGQGDAVDTPTQEIKGGIDAGVGRASGGAEGTGGRMNEGGQRTQHKAERDEDANRQQNVSAGSGGGGGGGGGGTGGGGGKGPKPLPKPPGSTSGSGSSSSSSSSGSSSSSSGSSSSSDGGGTSSGEGS